MTGFYMKCNTGPKWVNKGDMKSDKVKGHFRKRNAQFVRKVTFEPLMDFKQPLWKFKILQKLLLLKVFITKIIKTQ